MPRTARPIRNIEFGFTHGNPQGAAPKSSAGTYSILLAADFAGSNPAAPTSPLNLDLDTFDELFTRIAPRITPADPLTQQPITPTDLDHFHPDSLLQTVPTLAHLADLRKRLREPDTFAAAAREAESHLATAPGPIDLDTTNPDTATPDSQSTRDQTQPTGAASLDDLLGGTPAEHKAKGQSPADRAQQFIQSLVGGDAVPAQGTEADALIARVESALAASLRAILADPAFRAVENAWLAAHRFITSVEVGEGAAASGAHPSVAVRIINVPAQSLHDPDAPAIAALRAALSEPPVGGSRPNLVALLHDVEPDDTTAPALASLSNAAAAADATLIAGAAPALLSTRSFAEDPDTWQSPAEAHPGFTAAAFAAGRTGLTLPRFLARQPYGPSDPIDAFDFNEIDPADLGSPTSHDQYAWCPAPILVAIAAAQSFLNRGNADSLGLPAEIPSLPLHTWTAPGDAASVTAKPIAESWITESQGQRLSAAGLIPVLSIKGRDSVRIGPVTPAQI